MSGGAKGPYGVWGKRPTIGLSLCLWGQKAHPGMGQKAHHGSHVLISLVYFIQSEYSYNLYEFLLIHIFHMDYKEYIASQELQYKRFINP